MKTLLFIKPLWKYMRPYRWVVVFIILGLSIELIYETGFRFSLKFLIDDVILSGDTDLFKHIFLLLAFGGVVYTVVCVYCDYLWAKYGVIVINDLCYDLFCHLQLLPLAYHEKKSTGDLMARFTADAEIIDNGLVGSLPVAFLSVGELLMAAFVLYNLEPFMFLLTLTGITISLFSPALLSRATNDASYKMRNYTGEISSSLQENLSSQKIIKAFSLGHYASSNYRKQLDHFVAIASRSYFLAYLSMRIPNLAFLILNILIMFAGGMLVMNNQISLGTLVSYQVIFVSLSAAIKNLTWIIPGLIHAAASMRRIHEVLTAPLPLNETLADSNESWSCTGLLEYRNVFFSYSKDVLILKNLSFILNPGTFAVFVGHSGAGKSSVINLLLKFYEKSAGRILVDNKDIELMTPAILRRQIGLVAQDIILFDISIADNIRLGNLDASQEDIEAAAKAAEIHDVIIDFPENYNTRCGKTGNRLLSGGECQRIALARALVRKPAFLVLDEATSALDPLAEQGILKTLRKLKKQCTIIAITHKLNLALEADVLFVMDDGEIVETGTHEQLLNQDGIYTTFWKQDHASFSIATDSAPTLL
jgi:ATP-binding cassette subfamily B protein